MEGSQNIPSNVEIANAIDSTTDIIHKHAMKNPKLDTRGKMVATGVENILQTTKEMIQERNSDEQIQKWAAHIADFQKRAYGEAERIKDDVKMRQGIEKLRDISQQFQSLSKQFFTSYEFRSLLMDLIDAFDVLFWKVSNKTNLKEKAKEVLSGTQESNQENAEIKKEDAQKMMNETQEQAKQAGEEIKEGVKEAWEEMSEEERGNLSNKFRSLLSQIADKPQYKQAIGDLMSIFDYFRQEQKNMNQQLSDELRQLYYEGFDILRAFMDNKDLKPLENSFWELYKTLNEDNETKNLFYHLRTWMKNILENPHLANDQEVIDEGSQIVRQADHLVRRKYAPKFKEILSELRDMLFKLSQDKFAQQMRDNFQEVQEAMAGASVFEVVSQMRYWAMPVLRELLNDFPLPRIEGHDETNSFVLDNLVLKGKKLSVDDVSATLRVGLRNLMELTFEVKNVHATVKSGHFSFHRSGPLMNFDDEGSLDVTMFAPLWKLKWVVKERKDQALVFEVDNVDVTISDMDINIEEAKHKLIDNIVTSMFSGSIRRRTQEEFEKLLLKNAEGITQKLNKAFFRNPMFSASQWSPYQQNTSTASQWTQSPQDTTPANPAAQPTTNTLPKSSWTDYQTSDNKGSSEPIIQNTQKQQQQQYTEPAKDQWLPPSL